MIKVMGPKLSRVILGACLLMTLAALPCLGQEDTRYQVVILHGKLTDPTSGLPMVGAVVRFVNSENSDQWVEAVTNETGEFVLEGLTFGKYTVEITTREGQSIRGVNHVPVGKDTVRIGFKISEKVDSTTTVENQPEQIVAAVSIREPDWRRFWKEFAIFFGAALGAGAAAF